MVLNLVVKIFKYDHSNASYWAVSPAILHAYYAVQMDSNFEFCTRDPHLNYQRLRNLATQYVSSVKSVLKTKRIFIWKFYTRFGVWISLHFAYFSSLTQLAKPFSFSSRFYDQWTCDKLNLVFFLHFNFNCCWQWYASKGLTKSPPEREVIVDRWQ